jgi:hypothetical protein
MYSRPSASVIVAPAPRRMNRGVPPTPRNARTGLLTPPGITFLARPNSAVDCGYLSLIWSSGRWFILMGEPDRAGHSLQASCEKSSVCGMIYVMPNQPQNFGKVFMPQSHRVTEDRGSKIEDLRSSNALRSSILDPRSSILCVSMASLRGQY